MTNDSNWENYGAINSLSNSIRSRREVLDIICYIDIRSCALSFTFSNNSDEALKNQKQAEIHVDLVDYLEFGEFTLLSPIAYIKESEFSAEGKPSIINISSLFFSKQLGVAAWTINFIVIKESVKSYDSSLADPKPPYVVHARFS